MTDDREPAFYDLFYNAGAQGFSFPYIDKHIYLLYIKHTFFLVWYPSGKGLVCKTIIGRFDSYPHLLKELPCEVLFFLPVTYSCLRLKKKLKYNKILFVSSATCFDWADSLESSHIPVGRRRVRKLFAQLLQRAFDISGTKDRVI